MSLNPNWHTWQLDFDELGIWIGEHEFGFFAGAVQMEANHIEAFRLDAHDGGIVYIGPNHSLFDHFKEATLRTPWMMQRIANWREEVAA